MFSLLNLNSSRVTNEQILNLIDNINGLCGEYFIAHFVVFLIQIMCDANDIVFELFDRFNMMSNVGNDLIFLHFVSVNKYK